MALSQTEMRAPVARALDQTRLGEIATWRAFAPHLHIADARFLQSPSVFAMNPTQAAAAREQVNAEGYVQVFGMNWGLDLPAMVATVRSLSEAGISPAFAFVYDEFWVPFRKIAPIVKALLGPYVMLPDCWVWNVEPKAGQAGWAPHRDRGRVSLLPDGSPKSLTVWLPLTPATPLSSCMYVVPAGVDPTYATDNEDQHTFDYQSIRALPAMPGDFIIWNQALLHWGSKASPLAPESRVSIAVQFERADQPPMREPVLDPTAVLAFEARLHLIAAQVVGYRNLYALSPALEKFAYGLIGHLVQ